MYCKARNFSVQLAVSGTATATSNDESKGKKQTSWASPLFGGMSFHGR
jgi:hypothetical protein